MIKKSIAHIFSTSGIPVLLFICLFLESFSPQPYKICDTVRMTEMVCRDETVFEDIEYFLKRSVFFQRAHHQNDLCILDFIKNRDRSIRGVMCYYTNEMDILADDRFSFVDSYLEHGGIMYFLDKSRIPEKYASPIDNVRTFMISPVSETVQDGCSILLYQTPDGSFSLGRIVPFDIDYLLFQRSLFNGSVPEDEFKDEERVSITLDLDDYHFSDSLALDNLKTIISRFKYYPLSVLESPNLFTMDKGSGELCSASQGDKDSYYISIERLDTIYDSDARTYRLEDVLSEDFGYYRSFNSCVQIGKSLILFNKNDGFCDLLEKTNRKRKLNLILDGPGPGLLLLKASVPALTFEVIDSQFFLSLVHSE